MLKLSRSSYVFFIEDVGVSDWYAIWYCAWCIQIWRSSVLAHRAFYIFNCPSLRSKLVLAEIKAKVNLPLYLFRICCAIEKTSGARIGYWKRWFYEALATLVDWEKPYMGWSRCGCTKRVTFSVLSVNYDDNVSALVISELDQRTKVAKTE